jgi:L-lactate permease
MDYFWRNSIIKCAETSGALDVIKTGFTFITKDMRVQLIIAAWLVGVVY